VPAVRAEALPVPPRHPAANISATGFAPTDVLLYKGGIRRVPKSTVCRPRCTIGRAVRSGPVVGGFPVDHRPAARRL